jgi:uncharacterized protein
MTLFLAILLIVVLLICWMMSLLGMPGNWLIVAFTALYSYFVSTTSSEAIGWRVVGLLIVLAAIGEIVELLVGVAGTAKAGGSIRSNVLALFGSITGSILGVFIGLPIPLVGPIFAALLFAALGAMVGAFIGETWAGKTSVDSWQVGKAAFIARLLGTLGKMLIGAVMVAVVLAALLL